MQLAGGDRCPASLSTVPATPSAIELWIADTAVPGGGSRFTLALGAALSAGGHSYRFDSGDVLFGSGSSGGVAMAIIGSIAIGVDGQARQITFDFGGCSEQSAAPANVVARISVMRGGMSQAVSRTYAVASTGASAGYQFTNSQAPAGCSTGVDLMGITF